MCGIPWYAAVSGGEGWYLWTDNYAYNENAGDCAGDRVPEPCSGIKNGMNLQAGVHTVLMRLFIQFIYEVGILLND